MTRTMKRTSGVLLLLLLLCAAWLGVSWYVGKRVQRASTAWLDDANRQLQAVFPGLPLALETERYDRGLFATHARYVLQARRPSLPDGGTAPAQRRALAWLDVEIEHGPYPKRPANSLDGKPGARGGALTSAARVSVCLHGTPALAGALHLAPPLTLANFDARVDYGGSADFRWRMRPWRAGEPEAYLTWQGATGSGRVERDGTLGLTFSADGLTVHTRNGETGDSPDMAGPAAPAAGGKATPAFEIADIAVALHLAPGRHVLRPGAVNVDIKRWRATLTDNAGEPAPWEADGMHWQSRVAKTGGWLDMDMEYGLAALRVGTDELGHGAGRARLAHLDGDALTRAMHDLRTLASLLVLGGSDSIATVTNTVTDLSRASLTLLNHQPYLAVQDMHWESPRDGTATLEATVQMGPTPDSTLNVDPVWAALERMRGLDLRARVPGAMLGGYPRLHAALRASGLFVEDGADLAADIRATEDQATINGETIPTTQWLTRFAGTRPPSVPLPRID